MSDTLTLLTYGTTGLLMALVAGVFLSFSDFVMRSLGAARPSAGIEAMQQINRKVYGSVFLVWLLGLVPVSAGLMLYAWFAIDGPAAKWFLTGGALYVLGTFLVTVLGNVPMNRRLDAMPPDGDATRIYWATYATIWTLWNHLRTAAAMLAAAAFLIGCVVYS